MSKSDSARELFCDVRGYTGEKVALIEVCHQYFKKHPHVDHLLVYIAGKFFRIEKTVTEETDTSVDSYIKELQGPRKEEKDRPYCEICSRYFTNRGNLRKHLRAHEEKKPNVCGICFKVFVYKNDLIVHYRVHTGERPYQCEKCLKQFRRKHHLNNHMATHMLEKPFKCGKCERTFPNRSEVKRHQEKHTIDCGVNPHVSTGKSPKTDSRHSPQVYECEICLMSFTSKQSFNNHEFVHTRTKAFQCHLCPRKFSYNCTLKDHMRSHSSDSKPYKCSMCAKGFWQKSNFDNHFLTHTGEKPHECVVCQRRFTEKTHLRRHLRTHTGERPHQCETCLKRFSLSNNLKEHMLIHIRKESK